MTEKLCKERERPSSEHVSDSLHQEDADDGKLKDLFGRYGSARSAWAAPHLTSVFWTPSLDCMNSFYKIHLFLFYLLIMVIFYFFVVAHHESKSDPNFLHELS